MKGSSTFLRNHDFGSAFEPREDRLGKDEAGVTSVACVEVAAVDACVVEDGVKERGGVEACGFRVRKTPPRAGGVLVKSAVFDGDARTGSGGGESGEGMLKGSLEDFKIDIRDSWWASK